MSLGHGEHAHRALVASAARNEKETKRSGEHKTIGPRPLPRSASAQAAAAGSMPEAISAAGGPPSRSRPDWSAISAITAQTTTVTAPQTMPGSR